MIVTQRKIGKRPGQCESAGCIRSARMQATFLGRERVRLCPACAKEWREAYQHALHGWPDERKAAA